MPTRKRQVEMSVVEHHADNTIRVQVYYDRTNQVFHATYAGEQYIDKIESMVRNLVYTAIEKSLDVPWTSAIYIKQLKPFANSMGDEYFIGFEIDRMWVARFPTGQWKTCQWNGRETGHLLSWSKSFAWDTERDGPFVPPCQRVWYSDTFYYLPYTDNLWEKLQYMRQKIRELRAQLLALFGSQEGLDQLLTSPWLTLPAPAEGVTR